MGKRMARTSDTDGRTIQTRYVRRDWKTEKRKIRRIKRKIISIQSLGFCFHTHRRGIGKTSETSRITDGGVSQL